MSYCVNCGVELETSLSSCPLCNTPIMNPQDLSKLKKTSPYPKEKGQVEEVKRKDLGLVIVIVLIATSISCFLLNLLLFTGNMWSIAIIGICLMLFVLCIPILFLKMSTYLALFINSISILVYLYLLTYVTATDEWFFGLALPIVILFTILSELFILLLRSFPVTILTTALYVFSIIAAFCVGLELLIDYFLGHPLSLFWSAIVLTVCSVIDAALIAILSRRRLRDAVRRRLHF